MKHSCLSMVNIDFPFCYVRKNSDPFLTYTNRYGSPGPNTTSSLRYPFFLSAESFQQIDAEFILMLEKNKENIKQDLALEQQDVFVKILSFLSYLVEKNETEEERKNEKLLWISSVNQSFRAGNHQDPDVKDVMEFLGSQKRRGGYHDQKMNSVLSCLEQYHLVTVNKKEEAASTINIHPSAPLDIISFLGDPSKQLLLLSTFENVISKIKKSLPASYQTESFFYDISRILDACYFIASSHQKKLSLHAVTFNDLLTKEYGIHQKINLEPEDLAFEEKIFHPFAIEFLERVQTYAQKRQLIVSLCRDKIKDMSEEREKMLASPLSEEEKRRILKEASRLSWCIQLLDEKSHWPVEKSQEWLTWFDTNPDMRWVYDHYSSPKINHDSGSRQNVSGPPEHKKRKL